MHQNPHPATLAPHSSFSIPHSALNPRLQSAISPISQTLSRQMSGSGVQG